LAYSLHWKDASDIGAFPVTKQPTSMRAGRLVRQGSAMDISYHDALKNAAALKQLGQTDIHLFAGSKPWDKATHCEPGCSFRNGIPVSATFHAEDSGLSFRWYFDLEARDANGASLFKVDTEACRKVMASIPPVARKSFRDWLASSAAAVREKGSEYQKAADNQFAIAACLSDICAE
jgi:hypothetical protein